MAKKHLITPHVKKQQHHRSSRVASEDGVIHWISAITVDADPDRP